VLQPAFADFKTFTSVDSAQTMEAKSIRTDGERVLLKSQTGQDSWFPVGSFSEADRNFIAGQTSASSAVATAANEVTEPPSKVKAALDPVLFDEKGKPTKIEGNPKYFLLYYSASWCPPCRAFSLDVVKTHRSLKKKGNDVEFILVSADKTEEAAHDYLKDYKMDFPGFFGRLPDLIPGNPSGGIPAVRVIDADGKTVLSSADMPTDEILKEVRKLVGDS